MTNLSLSTELATLADADYFGEVMTSVFITTITRRLLQSINLQQEYGISVSAINTTYGPVIELRFAGSESLFEFDACSIVTVGQGPTAQEVVESRRREEILLAPASHVDLSISVPPDQARNISCLMVSLFDASVQAAMLADGSQLLQLRGLEYILDDTEVALGQLRDTRANQTCLCNCGTAIAAVAPSEAAPFWAWLLLSLAMLLLLGVLFIVFLRRRKALTEEDYTQPPKKLPAYVKPPDYSRGTPELDAPSRVSRTPWLLPRAPPYRPPPVYRVPTHRPISELPASSAGRVMPSYEAPPYYEEALALRASQRRLFLNTTPTRLRAAGSAPPVYLHPPQFEIPTQQRRADSPTFDSTRAATPTRKPTPRYEGPPTSIFDGEALSPIRAPRAPPAYEEPPDLPEAHHEEDVHTTGLQPHAWPTPPYEEPPVFPFASL